MFKQLQNEWILTSQLCTQMKKFPERFFVLNNEQRCVRTCFRMSPNGLTADYSMNNVDIINRNDRHYDLSLEVTNNGLMNVVIATYPISYTFNILNSKRLIKSIKFITTYWLYNTIKNYIPIERGEDYLRLLINTLIRQGTPKDNITAMFEKVMFENF